MKTIRKYIRKFSITMSLCVLLVSCSQYEEINSSNDNLTSNLLRNGKTYTGVEMFKGIYFLQNDIADNISHLSTIKEMIEDEQSIAIQTSLRDLSEISVVFINNNYPTFFNDFKTKLESDNLYEIDLIIDFGAKLIEQSALASNEYRGAFLFNEKIQSDENLRTQVENLDLSTQAGIDELNQILLDNSNGGQVGNIWSFVFYAVAVVISIVAALYSVYYKVAYWGPKVKSTGIHRNGQNIDIDRETYIAELGTFFSTN